MSTHKLLAVGMAVVIAAMIGLSWLQGYPSPELTDTTHVALSCRSGLCPYELWELDTAENRARLATAAYESGVDIDGLSFAVALDRVGRTSGYYDTITYVLGDPDAVVVADLDR